jgi:glycosyltransferase involved in cell wall biosynthesis
MLRYGQFVNFLAEMFRPRRRKVLGVPIPKLDEWLGGIDSFSSPLGTERIGGFKVPETPFLLATVIVSTFRSETYLDRFISNLLEQQSIERCEVIIILSDPSDTETSILRQRLGHLPYIRLVEIGSHITIYQAWNTAIQESSAPYITNMNVDDLRHPQSLAIQIAEAYSSKADVVWQDFYLSIDPRADWESIKSFGRRSNLSPPTASTLSRGINAPHNAPMWKRELHERVGYFDERLTSGADHDFWIRAAISGAKFYKSPHVHVSYFFNPQGMSTKLGSPSLLEGMGILHKYRKQAKLFSNLGIN